MSASTVSLDENAPALPHAARSHPPAPQLLAPPVKLSTKLLPQQPSYPKAFLLLAKICVLYTLGGFCTWQIPPLGILISCIALTAADCVRQDCGRGVFFASQALNKALGVFLHLLLRSWSSMIFVGVVVAAMHDLFCDGDSSSWSWPRRSLGGKMDAASCGSVFAALNYFLLPALIMRLNVATLRSRGRVDDEDTSAVDRLVPGLTKKIDALLRGAESLTGGGSSSGAALHDTALPTSLTSRGQNDVFPQEEQFPGAEGVEEADHKQFPGAEGVEDTNDFPARRACTSSPPDAESAALPFSGSSSASLLGFSASAIPPMPSLSLPPIPVDVPLYHVHGYVKELTKVCTDAQLQLSEAFSEQCSLSRDSAAQLLEQRLRSLRCVKDELQRASHTAFTSMLGGGASAEGGEPISTSATPMKKLSKRELKKLHNQSDPFHAFVRFLLTPVRLAFQSFFLFGTARDLVFYAAVAAYLILIAIGLQYFSYTPVAVLLGLLGPKTRAGKFMQERFYFSEQEKMLETVLDKNKKNSKVDDEHTQTRTISSESPVKKSLSWTQRLHHRLLGDNRLNLFMCLYLGFFHAMAIHAIVVLYFFDGKDELLNVGDILIKKTLNALFGTQLATEPASLPVQSRTLLFAALLWPISALGITAGAHRLWAHKSYQAHFIPRLVLMLFNSIANQGTLFHWARDHRVHHLHSDTAADPHDSNRGWFFSHMGWLLVKKNKAVLEAGRKVDVRDLQADPIVMFQKYADPWWNGMLCFALPAFIPLYFWGETLWNGFLFAGVLRYVWSLHCTWLVNSLVHTDFGPSTYDEEEPPSESRIVAFLALGEGWHSWHHAFPFDYTTAELGVWQQWNPSKVFIDFWGCFGLVWGRKTGQRMWAVKKERLSKEAARRGEVIEEVLEGPPFFKVRKIKYIKAGQKSRVSSEGAVELEDGGEDRR